MVFGGYDVTGDLQDCWRLTMTPSPHWAPIHSPDPIPSARVFASGIYDPVRERMVLYGGEATLAQYPMDDAWALSLEGPQEWALLHQTGTAWHGRQGPGVAYDPIGDQLVVFSGSLYGEPYGRDNETWALTWHDGVTSVLASLAHQEVREDRVTLVWHTPSRPAQRPSVYRREETGNWIRIGSTTGLGLDSERFDDTSVVAGAAYWYRLGIASGGVEVPAGEVRVVVPARADLSLVVPLPQAVGGLRVLLVSKDGAPITIEAFDMSGRRVASRRLQQGAGRRELDLGTIGPPGVYFVRATQGNRVASAKAVLLR